MLEKPRKTSQLSEELKAHQEKKKYKTLFQQTHMKLKARYHDKARYRLEKAIGFLMVSSKLLRIFGVLGTQSLSVVYYFLSPPHRDM